MSASWTQNGLVVFESDDPAASDLIRRLAFLEREATQLRQRLWDAEDRYRERWFFLVPRRLHPRLRRWQQTRKWDRLDKEIRKALADGR